MSWIFEWKSNVYIWWWPRLPIEYQEVEYIESSGTQYIATQITPTDTTWLYMKLISKNVSSDEVYCWAATNNQDSWNKFWIWNTSSKMYFWWNSWTASSNRPSVTAGVLMEVELNYMNSRYSKKDWTNVDSLWTLNTIWYSLNIFWHNWANTAQYFSEIKLYSLKVSDWESIIANFIPCFRKSDWEPWIYDLVNNQFYTNAWTGRFLIWRDVAYLPDWYEQVEYISNSTWEEHMDLWLVGNNTLKVSFLLMPTYLNNDNGYIWWIWSSNDFLLTTYQSKFRMHNGWNYVDTATTTINTLYDLRVDNTWITINWGKYNLSAWTNYPTHNLWLYQVEWQTTSTAPRFRTYWLRMWNQWEFVRDYVPCVRTSDWVIWLYDVVNSTFHYNEWNWAFYKWDYINDKYRNYTPIEDILVWKDTNTPQWVPNEHTQAYYPLTEDFDDHSGNWHDLVNWLSVISSIDWIPCAYSNWWNKYWSDNIWTTTQPFTVSIWWRKNANNNDWAAYRWNWNNANNQSAWMWINWSWILMIWKWNADTSTGISVDNTWHNVISAFDWTNIKIFFDWDKVYEWPYSYSINSKPNRLFSNAADGSLLNWYLRENIYEDYYWSDEQCINYYNQTCVEFWKQYNTKKLYNSIVWVYKPILSSLWWLTDPFYKTNEYTEWYRPLIDNWNSGWVWPNLSNLWRVQFWSFHWIKCAKFDWIYSSNTDCSCLYTSLFWNLQWNQSYTISVWLYPEAYNTNEDEVISIWAPWNNNQCFQFYKINPIWVWTWWNNVNSSTILPLYRRSNIIITSNEWQFTITVDWNDIVTWTKTQDLQWYFLTLWMSWWHRDSTYTYKWCMSEVIIESRVWDSTQKTSYYDNSKRRYYPNMIYKKIWRDWWSPNEHTMAYYPLNSSTTTYDVKTSGTLYNLTNYWISFWTYQWVDCAQFSPNTSSSYTRIWLYNNSWAQIINNSWFTWACWLYHYWFVRDNPRLCDSYAWNPSWILLKTSAGTIVAWTPSENNWYPFDSWAWHLRSMTWSFSQWHFKLYKDWELVKDWTWTPCTIWTWLDIWWTSSASTVRYWSDQYNWLMSERLLEDIIWNDYKEKDYYYQTKSRYWY